MTAAYCSKTCQLKDWRVIHLQECTIFARNKDTPRKMEIIGEMAPYRMIARMLIRQKYDKAAEAQEGIS